MKYITLIPYCGEMSDARAKICISLILEELLSFFCCLVKGCASIEG